MSVFRRVNLNTQGWEMVQSCVFYALGQCSIYPSHLGILQLENLHFSLIFPTGRHAFGDFFY